MTIVLAVDPIIAGINSFIEAEAVLANADLGGRALGEPCERLGGDRAGAVLQEGRQLHLGHVYFSGYERLTRTLVTRATSTPGGGV